MPSIVAVSVRNCAIASNTFAAMSWSLLMSIDAKAKAVATAKDATASDLSRNRVCITQTSSGPCHCHPVTRGLQR